VRAPRRVRRPRAGERAGVGQARVDAVALDRRRSGLAEAARAVGSADRRCARTGDLLRRPPIYRGLDAVETDGRAAQPTRPLPTGVVFWRAHEAVGEGEPDASGSVWWFVVPRVARETAERASRDLGWAMRDIDGDGRWDPLDLHGVVTERADAGRVVRTWLVGHGAAPVAAVGDLDGDGYVDFAGADPLRDAQAGRVVLWWVRSRAARSRRGARAPWGPTAARAAGGRRR